MWSVALLLTVPAPATPAQDNQSLDNQQITQQAQGSAESLAEATQLSLTVVKLYNQGKFDEALPLAKRALALREAALGPDHEIVQGLYSAWLSCIWL